MSRQFILITIQCVIPLCHFNKLPDFLKELMKDYNLTSADYNPTYGYEPYWADGEWVFQEEELPPNVTTTPIPLVCGEECNYLYLNIGPVCARQTNNREYDGCWDLLGYFCYGHGIDDLTRGFRTFPTYCRFLDWQCRSEFSSRWILVHSGPCVTNQELTFKPIAKAEQPLGRVKTYFTRLRNVLINMTLPAIDFGDK